MPLPRSKPWLAQGYRGCLQRNWFQVRVQRVEVRLAVFTEAMEEARLEWVQGLSLL